jgi:DNA-binding NtrC family response regulator
MREEDLHLWGLLEFHPDEGTIYCKDERMLVCSASVLGALQKLLVDRLGIEEARKALCQLGYQNGFHSYLTVEQLFGKSHKGSNIGPRFHGIMGFQQCKTIHVQEGINPPSFSIENQYQDSIEVDQFLTTFGKSNIPVCWWIIGFASGYCSAAFDLEIYYKELSCAAQGNHSCKMQGRDAAQWGPEVENFRMDYGFANDREAGEFRERHYELHRQRHLNCKQAQRDRSRHEPASEEGFLRHRLVGLAEEDGFIVRGDEMWKALEYAATVAKLNTPVLVQGESGTGKEFVANLIHRQSARVDQPLVSINCAALTETLLESELFGHVRGAFTGAVSDKPGLFEIASEGTLFLDEIGEMPLSAQAKLLRVLENGEMRRIGGTRLIRVNPRIIAATNRNIQVLAEKGEFRKDLYFRLNSFVIELPALRKRRESIPVMAQHFLQQTSTNFNKKIEAISPDAMSRLVAYSWPGNVRELKHAIERAVVVVHGPVIGWRDLPPEITRVPKSDGASYMNGKRCVDLKESERQAITHALAEHGGNRMATASALNIDVSTLWRKMRRHELL